METRIYGEVIYNHIKRNEFLFNAGIYLFIKLCEKTVIV
jgi:hypothetical protein